MANRRGSKEGLLNIVHMDSLSTTKSGIHVKLAQFGRS